MEGWEGGEREGWEGGEREGRGKGRQEGGKEERERRERRERYRERREERERIQGRKGGSEGGQQGRMAYLCPPESSCRESFHTDPNAILTSSPSNISIPSGGESLALVPGRSVENIEPKSYRYYFKPCGKLSRQRNRPQPLYKGLVHYVSMDNFLTSNRKYPPPPPSQAKHKLYQTNYSASLVVWTLAIIQTRDSHVS